MPKLNYKRSPIDNRDHILNFSKLKPAESASSDLSQFCTSIKDQGSVGSCTAHAGVALMEYFYRKNMGGKIDDLFSEKFLYYTTRVDIEKTPRTDDSGAYVRDTLKSMVQFGVCLEQTFPYLSNGETFCRIGDTPTQDAYSEALKYQVTKYARILETDKNQCLSDLKNLLQNGNAFIGGFICYENIFKNPSKNFKGLIPMPAGKIIGGHAVLFVGFDDAQKVFKFKNSWGTSWGDNGYGYLPYQYILSGNMSDLWTVYQEEFDNKPFDIIVPKNRATCFKQRLNEILVKLAEGTDLSTVISSIQNNPDNSLLFKQDIVELVSFVNKVNSQINTSQTNSSRIKP